MKHSVLGVRLDRALLSHQLDLRVRDRVRGCSSLATADKPVPEFEESLSCCSSALASEYILGKSASKVVNGLYGRNWTRMMSDKLKCELEGGETDEEQRQTCGLMVCGGRGGPRREQNNCSTKSTSLSQEPVKQSKKLEKQ